MIPSPCVNRCRLIHHTGRCAGCNRTKQQIAVWGSLTAARALEIMATLEKPGGDHEGEGQELGGEALPVNR